jgi:hypothetical protein
MSVVNAIPLLLGDEGYNISRSVRLRSSASATFSRTPGSASNRRTWTWSGWVKRGRLGTENGVFSAKQTKDDITGSYFNTADKLVFIDRPSGATNALLGTTMVFRDPSAWYHIIVQADTTNATSSDRLKIYVNGVRVTAFDSATYPSQNYELAYINNTVDHRIGAFQDNTPLNFDGYLTEVNFIDGQALTPSSFGETDAITGVWKPKKYAGTYGTNGFYLNFSDPSAATAAAIGKDYSGNGNNWTPNNISVTAGVTYDSMIDVPTLYADRGNYCTLNPLIQRWAVASATFSNANQTITTSGASTSFGFGTIAVSSGKFYWEATVTAVGTATPGVGVTTNEAQSTVQTNTDVYQSNGQKEVGGSASSYGASYTTNDVIGVALDCDSGTVTFYKNNTSQGSISLVTSANLLPHFQVISNSTFNANFGQRPFAFSVPSGFKALNTFNLP